MNPPILPVLEALNSEFTGASLHTWGGWQQIKCAFHGDRHASASVNVEENVFVCHTCGIAGDAYQMVMEVERVDFPTAKQRVASITGGGDSSLREESHERFGGGRTRLPGVSGDSADRRARLSARGRGKRITRSP